MRGRKFSPYQFHFAIPFGLTCEDVWLNLCDTLRDLGYSCTVGKTPSPEKQNVTLNILNWPCPKPPDAIKLQLEHLYQDSPDRSSLLRQLQGAFQVWDFKEKNWDFLSLADFPAFFFRLGYHPRLSRAPYLQEEKVFDVAFLIFGESPRRKKFVQALRELNLNVYFGGNIFGYEKSLLYARSKVGIQVHMKEETNYLTPRVLDMLNNGMCVVTEDFADKEQNLDILPALSIVPLGDASLFAAEVRRLVDQPEERARRSEEALRIMKRRPTLLPVPPAYVPVKKCRFSCPDQEHENPAAAVKTRIFHFRYNPSDQNGEYLSHSISSVLRERYPACEISTGDFLRLGAFNISFGSHPEEDPIALPGTRDDSGVTPEVLVLTEREKIFPQHPASRVWMLGRDFYPGYSPRRPAVHLSPREEADVVFTGPLPGSLPGAFPGLVFCDVSRLQGAALDAQLASARLALCMKQSEFYFAPTGENKNPLEAGESWICRCLDFGLEVVTDYPVRNWLKPYVWEVEGGNLGDLAAQVATLRYAWDSLRGRVSAGRAETRRGWRERKSPAWKTRKTFLPDIEEEGVTLKNPPARNSRNEDIPYPLLEETPIFVVSLTRATQRRKKMRRRLRREGLLGQTTWVAAVDAKSEEDRSLIEERRRGHFFPGLPISDGESACFMSHLRALRCLVETGRSHGLILEDDVMLCNRDFSALKSTTQKNQLRFCNRDFSAQKNQDFVSCGSNFSACYNESLPREKAPLLMFCHYISSQEGIRSCPGDERWQRIGGNTYHAGAYLISREYALECISLYDRPWRLIPDPEQRFTSEHITIRSGGLCLKHPLVVEEAEESYLRGAEEVSQHQKYFDFWKKKGDLRYN